MPDVEFSGVKSKLALHFAKKEGQRCDGIQVQVVPLVRVDPSSPVVDPLHHSLPWHSLRIQSQPIEVVCSLHLSLHLPSVLGHVADAVKHHVRATKECVGEVLHATALPPITVVGCGDHPSSDVLDDQVPDVDPRCDVDVVAAQLFDVIVDGDAQDGDIWIGETSSNWSKHFSVTRWMFQALETDEVDDESVVRQTPDDQKGEVAVDAFFIGEVVVVEDTLRVKGHDSRFVDLLGQNLRVFPALLQGGGMVEVLVLVSSECPPVWVGLHGRNHLVALVCRCLSHWVTWR